MKRLVGGDYLLDLSSIEIEESVDGTTKTNITDSDVLEQLTNLKKYIKNPEMAKPVWVKLKNGENDDLVIARGTFAVVDTGEFEICVQLDGYKLVIFIEFTQATLSDDTPIDDWYIDTNDAKYLFTSELQNINAITSSGDLPSVKADEIIENMTGYSFILGTKENLTIDGVYAGAVKNGNKLTLVVAVDLTRTGTIADDINFGTFTLPQDIASKIYPSLVGSFEFVDNKVINAWYNDSAFADLSSFVRKNGNNLAFWINVGPANDKLTLNTKAYYRYELTLLLSDNLIPQP